MNVWLLFIAIGVITFSFRASLILTAGSFRMPKRLERALRYVPPAVLMALVVPQILAVEGALDLSPGNPRLLAAVLAGVVATLTKNMLATICAGMAALWTFSALL